MRRSVVTLGLAEPEESESPASGGDSADDPLFKTVQMPPRQPGGMAASTLLHVLIIALVVQAAIVHAPAAPPKSIALPRADAVFLPRPAEVRKMLGLPPPKPKPPEPAAKDRISVGPPSTVRAERMILHRDDDLTKVAKGTSVTPDSQRVAQAMPPPPTPPPARPVGTSIGEGGRLVAPAPVALGAPGPIQSSLRRFAASAGEAGPFGVKSGAGGQMGPLFFDPQGADFTVWVQHWKNEVYRNWILPPAAEFGLSGQSDLEFVVDRSGAVTEVRLIHSSGVPALDRAARNALASARLLPLPADYAPATLTIDVSMSVNARPVAGDGSGR